MSAKKVDGTAVTVTTPKKATKKTFGKRYAIPLDFDFFKYSVYSYGLKEGLIIRLKLNSSKEVILCRGDTTASLQIMTQYLTNVMPQLYVSCMMDQRRSINLLPATI